MAKTPPLHGLRIIEASALGPAAITTGTRTAKHPHTKAQNRFFSMVYLLAQIFWDILTIRD